MIENRFLLDTNAVIYLTTKGNSISNDIEKQLDEADLFISIISEIELFSKPEIPQDEEENLRSFISERLPVINLSSAIKNETINLRRKIKHKLPDCIVAATAIVLDAVLLTADKKLLNISFPGLRTQNILPDHQF
ncbi:MAG: type II toxin-antitoxin system VapC family toxin [Treponema sp.]|nr:type II toxin-antitoxin system VapC family toxin [Treponema sp.]MCL2251062.1 type II toxin-antitoxin system VapC family toxin [Treponema sp.]